MTSRDVVTLCQSSRAASISLSSASGVKKALLASILMEETVIKQAWLG